MVAEGAARQGIEALQQLKTMRHHHDDADVRHKRDRADLVHKITIHLGSLQAHDTAERHVEHAGAGFLMFGIDAHGETLGTLQCQKRFTHMLLGADQREKRAAAGLQRRPRLRRQQIDVGGGQHRYPGRRQRLAIDHKNRFRRRFGTEKTQTLDPLECRKFFSAPASLPPKS